VGVERRHGKVAERLLLYTNREADLEVEDHHVKNRVEDGPLQAEE